MKWTSNKKDARSNGHLYYFTGKPCHRGHVGLRKVKGRGSCVECTKLLNRLKRQSDQGNVIREKRKRWRADNPKAAKLKGKIKRDRDPVRYKLALTKHRAKKLGVEFSLTKNDIVIPKRCPVLGIELRASNRARDPYSPSIDRIHNDRGYTSDNIVIVSLRANALKGDATIRELQLIANFYSKLTRKRK